MNRSILVILVVLVLLATACGSSDETAAEDTGTASSSTQTAEQAQALINELGSDEAAADALIIAMERGYSAQQILDALDDGELAADGTIPGQDPASPELGLVAYEAFQVELTPIEQVRESAARDRGVGEAMTAVIIARLKAGFTPQDIIETLILGVDEVVDDPTDPDAPYVCLRIVDEVYCPYGDRYPAPTPTAPAGEETADAPVEPTSAPATAAQLSWEGELIPDPAWVDDPVEGTYVLTRTAGTDDFHIRLVTTDAKSGTFTTDGFDEVECTAHWSSDFEGSGTFWDVNDLGIEFEGQITRTITYVAGPCDTQPEPNVDDFSGVVVFITPEGIQLSFNAWSFEAAGPPPVPIGN